MGDFGESRYWGTVKTNWFGFTVEVPLNTLKVLLLLITSGKDAMLHSDIIEEYEKIIYEHPPVKMIIFPTGKHPSLLSNAVAASTAIKEFLSSSKQRR